MAQKFTTPITIRQLSSAGSDGLTIYVDGETYSRLQIQGGGRLVWGDGTAVGDVNLYRDEANVLKTDDTLKVPVLFIDGIEVDTSGATTDQVLVYNGTKFAPGASASGGASVTIADTPPSSPTAGDLWYESDTGTTFVYYDSFWVEVGGGVGATILDGLNDVVLSSPTNGQVLKYNGTNWVNGTDDAGTTISTLDDIGDVTIGVTILSGAFLKWNGTAWVDDIINLGTDTTGDYVASLVAGSDIVISNNSGEGATPTVALNPQKTRNMMTYLICEVNP